MASLINMQTVLSLRTDFTRALTGCDLERSANILVLIVKLSQTASNVTCSCDVFPSCKHLSRITCHLRLYDSVTWLFTAFIAFPTSLHLNIRHNDDGLETRMFADVDFFFTSSRQRRRLTFPRERRSTRPQVHCMSLFFSLHDGICFSA